jgi:hypothetical protein
LHRPAIVDPTVLDLEGLDARDDREPELVRHPDPDLEVRGVAGLVAEHQQVVGLAGVAAGDDHVGYRGRDVAGPPRLCVGLDQDGGADAHGEGVAHLLQALLGAHRKHGCRTALGLDRLHGALDGALLVRADRPADVACVDRPPVVGQRHATGRARHPLDADEDLHLPTP